MRTFTEKTTETVLFHEHMLVHSCIVDGRYITLCNKSGNPLGHSLHTAETEASARFYANVPPALWVDISIDFHRDKERNDNSDSEYKTYVLYDHLPEIGTPEWNDYQERLHTLFTVGLYRSEELYKNEFKGDARDRFYLHAERILPRDEFSVLYFICNDEAKSQTGTFLVQDLFYKCLDYTNHTTIEQIIALLDSERFRQLAKHLGVNLHDNGDGSYGVGINRKPPHVEDIDRLMGSRGRRPLEKRIKLPEANPTTDFDDL